MKRAEEKNRLLRSVAGGGVEQLNQTMQQWDKFELMLDSHQLMIKEQVQKLIVITLKSPNTTH
jgi:dynein heavy chain 2